MTTYNTGNPLGSTAVKDLYDNAQNLDDLVNGPALQYPDRFGVARKSYKGIETDALNALEQVGYVYTSPVTYAAGITITLPNQIFEKDGEYYKPAPGVPLPYVTTGNWATEQANFRSVGDATLRSALAQPNGFSLVGGSQQTADSIAVLRTMPTTSNSRHARTAGYYLAGDGGGGSYYVSSTGGLTDNGATIIEADDGGFWLLDHKNRVSLRQAGANGVAANDTAAWQTLMALALVTKNFTVVIDEGVFKIKAGYTYSPGSVSATIFNVSIIGKGRSSVLNLQNDTNLLTINALAYMLSFSDFVVTPSAPGTSTSNVLFKFPHGNCETDFTNVHLTTNGTNFHSGFYSVAAGKTNDSVNFNNCYISAAFLGMQFGAGSSVYITGGRVIGPGSVGYLTNQGSGLVFTGGMGGVWVTNTDIIHWGSGAIIGEAAGVTNREIFFNGVCIDSCYVGLTQADSSYFEWSGVWIASCTSCGFNFFPGTAGGIAKLEGGTIFNMGSYSSSLASEGIQRNANGRLMISDVAFRDNAGPAVRYYSSSHSYDTITTCRFFNNSKVKRTQQVFLSGPVTFKDNEIEVYAGVKNIVLDTPGSMWIYGNRGVTGMNLRAGPAVATSGASYTNTTGQQITGYFSGGSYTSVVKNGATIVSSGTALSGFSIDLSPGDNMSAVFTALGTVNWQFS